MILDLVDELQTGVLEGAWLYPDHRGIVPSAGTAAAATAARVVHSLILIVRRKATAEGDTE